MQWECWGRGTATVIEMVQRAGHGAWEGDEGCSRWSSMSEGAGAGRIRCTENNLPGV